MAYILNRHASLPQHFRVARRMQEIENGYATARL